MNHRIKSNQSIAPIFDQKNDLYPSAHLVAWFSLQFFLIFIYGTFPLPIRNYTWKIQLRWLIPRPFRQDQPRRKLLRARSGPKEWETWGATANGKGVGDLLEPSLCNLTMVKRNPSDVNTYLVHSNQWERLRLSVAMIALSQVSTSWFHGKDVETSVFLNAD